MLLEIHWARQKYLILSESIIAVSKGVTVNEYDRMVIIFSKERTIEIECESVEKAESIIVRLAEVISIDPPIIIF